MWKSTHPHPLLQDFKCEKMVIPLVENEAPENGDSIGSKEEAPVSMNSNLDVFS